MVILLTPLVAASGLQEANRIWYQLHVTCTVTDYQCLVYHLPHHPAALDAVDVTEHPLL